MAKAKKTPPKTSRTMTHNGGSLQVGNPGNKGGTGRVPSVLRAELRGSYSERKKLLDEVADGAVMVHTKVQLRDILGHVHCPNCGEAGLKLKEDTDPELEIPAIVSPTVKDRLAALDQMAKYGLGPQSALTVEAVTEKLREQWYVLQRALAPKILAQITPALRQVWRAA